MNRLNNDMVDPRNLLFPAYVSKLHVPWSYPYIGNNAGSIVNYGECYRNGERISTGFVESTINQMISKRMVKKQQMQWTPEGAHLLLQVRTAVLNEEWEETFRTWYPAFRPVPIPAEEARPAA